MNKILIIDDDKTFRIILKETLIKEGYYTMEADSGKKGLEMVISEQPDLVITDFQMPGMSGLDVLQAIIKMKTGIPVIMITGFSDTENIIKAIQIGAFDYLEKPVNPSVLKQQSKLHLSRQI